MTDWYKIKRILVRQNNQEKQIYPATWNPGSNTVAYYPFKNNTNDETWNTTLSWTMVQDWLWYKPTTSVTINLWWRQPMFIWYWINILSRPSSNHISSPISENIGVWYYLYHALSSLRKKIFCFYNSSYAQSTVSFEPSLNTWHHLAMWYDWTKTIYAIDWVVWTLYNWKWYNFNNAITIDGWWWYYIVSDLISETECWTAQEINNYYNLTKSNYGL